MSSTRPVWVRSSACNADACVEVAAIGDRVGVRDSKLKDESPVVEMYPDEFGQFQSEIAVGDRFARPIWAWLAEKGLHFTDDEKTKFIAGIERGDFDHLASS